MRMSDLEGTNKIFSSRAILSQMRKCPRRGQMAFAMSASELRQVCGLQSRILSIGVLFTLYLSASSARAAKDSDESTVVLYLALTLYFSE